MSPNTDAAAENGAVDTAVMTPALPSDDESRDLKFSVNPIVTLVRSKSGHEMVPSELWAHHRIFDTLGLEFLYVDKFHLSLPCTPEAYLVDEEKQVRTRDVGCGIFPQHPHINVQRWTYSKMCLGEAFSRCPAECHRAWNMLGLTSRVRTSDLLGGVLSIRGYDDKDRLTVQVMMPPSFVWYHN